MDGSLKRASSPGQLGSAFASSVVVWTDVIRYRCRRHLNRGDLRNRSFESRTRSATAGEGHSVKGGFVNCRRQVPGGVLLKV